MISAFRLTTCQTVISHTRLALLLYLEKAKLSIAAQQISSAQARHICCAQHSEWHTPDGRLTIPADVAALQLHRPAVSCHAKEITSCKYTGRVFFDHFRSTVQQTFYDQASTYLCYKLS
ncbi:hypothetical protein CEXT_309381 [Caerostris extrusa]|uniref:Uncharacterized protein n=1 Tax=Caerostris extrusa TaxID=172846 RepID=A0AAV4NWC4_CAEEX|nr:hypothetical protein CEXT_309381 [Caerostris extrusa]